VRWNDHNPFFVSRMMGSTLKELLEATSPRKQFTWLSPGETIKAMTNGTVNVVIIPAPPNDMGDKRVYFWLGLLMADDVMTWGSAGPFTWKEIMEVTDVLSENDTAQFPVKIKLEDGQEHVLSPGDSLYDMAKRGLYTAFDDLLVTALEYFARIGEASGSGSDSDSGEELPGREINYERRQ